MVFGFGLGKVYSKRNDTAMLLLRDDKYFWKMIKPYTTIAWPINKKHACKIEWQSVRYLDMQTDTQTNCRPLDLKLRPLFKTLLTEEPMDIRRERTQAVGGKWSIDKKSLADMGSNLWCSVRRAHSILEANMACAEGQQK